MKGGWADPARAAISRAAAARRRWRGPLLAAAVIVVLAGGAYSAARLDLEWADLAHRPLALLVLALAPLNLIYAALSMKLTAAAVGADLSFGRSFRVGCVAQIAEIAPAPGGAIVRGAALVEKGVAPGRATGIVVANAALTVAVALVAAAFAVGTRIGAPVWAVAVALAAGCAAIALSAFWIARLGSARVAALSVALRGAGLVLAAARMLTAFAVLSLAIAPADGIVFAFAATLGSAASIAPAGLGVSEALAALFAAATAAAPAAAFLAVALDRLVGLAVAAAFCGVFAVAPDTSAARGREDAP